MELLERAPCSSNSPTTLYSHVLPFLEMLDLHAIATKLCWHHSALVLLEAHTRWPW